MTPAEAKQALFLLTGHWPNPKMEPPEVAIWGGHMTGWTMNEFNVALRKVTLVVDRPPFRPVPSEIAQLIAAQRRRDRPDTPQLASGERLCTPDENAAALERILAKSSTTPCFNSDAR